ncbi:hypothetical protein [Delftia phage PhiW-14]|uniref:Uncharacterized protein n=1 Tax=Delftia phage PhiW-14 TaxID=665032 RepID=C9DGJ3_BPW14|nr:hypothetical protein DP-phiW-14_gp223 [Delftia phage PhiW-14]ACV50244.1 hypothetical protein [Delftia phage PhiW-14]
MSNLTGVASRYRSRYTGRQIDELLGSIRGKIDTTYIVNDWSGGKDLVSSAELSKLLYERLEKFNDPIYVKELYLTIPDADIFTKQDRAKLDRTIGFFLGSFPNAAERNLAINTIGFKGGELTFLMDDGEGLQELSYWDTSSLSWQKSKWTREMNGGTEAPSTGSDTAVIVIDRNKFSAGKYMVKATQGLLVQVIELLVVIAGDHAWWTSYAPVGNLTGFSIKGISVTTATATISVTAPTGTMFKFQRIAEV